MEIGILGGGSWGTALAVMWASAFERVDLWVRNADDARVMTETRFPARYLREIPLPANLHVTSDLASVVRRHRVLGLAIPLPAYRDFLNQFGRLFLDHDLILLSKGIEVDSLLFPSQIVCDVLGASWESRTFALSGPSFAREVAVHKPTTVVLTGPEGDRLLELREQLATPRFRLYSNPDIVGVELAGAMKNVIAIAAGIAQGMEFGSNTMAGLITRGLAEISRLGEKMGGKRETFAGLAGMGDLILTCTGSQSRNLTVGIRLAEGLALPQILKELGMVAEGVKTTKAARQLSAREGVELPITEVVHGILYEGLTPRQGLAQLMTRSLKSEV
ncbi:MAG: NAD(P)-dependent glycerol-3-phosphate dehydrogenase [Acidobacteria bacterium]|nr:NAD(P)-dependent glycerol-3-phosphate dehydrogenase [Acidobacteriota bacterium]